MICNLTEQQREKGVRCRSWTCEPCRSFETKNDHQIINIEMIKMLEKENEELRRNLKVCKRDYEYMTMLLTESLTKVKTVMLDSQKDCITRMEYRKPLFKILEPRKMRVKNEEN